MRDWKRILVRVIKRSLEDVLLDINVVWLALRL
jgi:hypothetical protein